MSRSPFCVALLLAGAVYQGSSLSAEPPGDPPVDKSKPAPARLLKVPVMLVLPSGALPPRESLVEMKGSGDSAPCRGIDRQGHPGEDGVTEFQDVPPCKVVVAASVTGFDTKKVKVDLAGEKSIPIRIELP